MNGKPNVEPPWMSLKRLIETRMVEILCKEQGNRKYIRLYGAGEYWHAYEESACQLSRISRNVKRHFSGIRTTPFQWLWSASPTVNYGLTSGSISRYATSLITKNCWSRNFPSRNTAHGMNTR